MNFLIKLLNVQTISFHRYFSNKPNLNRLLLTMSEKPLRPKLNKTKSKSYIPGTVNLQIVGSGAAGSPGSLYLFTDQSRYLFNCGEGTQRLAHEHRTKLSRLEQIFMTRTGWERIGGLPGLCLTVQDAGVTDIQIHGPPGLDDFFPMMHRFVVLKDLKLTANLTDRNRPYEDHIMRIDSINIFHRNGVDFVTSYVCRLKPRPGTLCLERCVDRGVPPGPLLGQLKNGIDVTLPNGTIVRAGDVREPDDPGPIFIVIDIPSVDFLPGFEIIQNDFVKYQTSNCSEDDNASCIVHFTPKNVMDTDIYTQFIRKFSPNTQQLIVNETNRYSGNTSIHRIQYKLNNMNSDIFPLLKEPTVNFDENNQEATECSSLTMYHLRPKRGLDRQFESKVTPDEYLKESESIDGYNDELKLYREAMNSLKSTIDRQSEYPKIVFLGTGSCIPNKTRNVSAILVHVNSDCCILLDCGEGTVGQIIRFYGSDGAVDIFNKLTAIYVSHLHADHHIGLIGLLQKRQQLMGNKVTKVLLMAPKQISGWLYFYNEKIEPIHHLYTLVPNSSLLESVQDERIKNIGLEAIQTCPVVHCPNSFGISLEIKSMNSIPTKITYSGDTMPSDALIDLGRNSTILIHEATMEDELVAEARVKMHSTVSEAIDQGVKMNAKYILLTHFSQRYAKLPRMDEVRQNVGIAFDNMEIVPSDLKHLHLMYPLLKVMFSEHCEEMEQKALKRAFKRKLLENTS